MPSGRTEELKKDLTATITYAERTGDRLANPDLSQAERADLESELEAVETKANALRLDYERSQKTDERELRIKNIGRENDLRTQRMDEEADAQVRYASAAEALFDTPEFKNVLNLDPTERGNRRWHADVEFKDTDPTLENPADLVPTIRPGLVQPFVYPQRIGDLFTRLPMSGSSISWLDVPTADGQADYAGYGTQKPGPADVGVDIHTTRAAKIATTYIVPDDALDDLTALRATIEQILTVGPNGIGVKAEAEYIAGSGVGTPLELAGLDSLSITDVSGSGANVVADVLFAGLEIETATGFAATAAVMNPSDYFWFITLEVDGRPLFAPYGSVYTEPRGGGLPQIVRSKAVPVGTIYVGAFDHSLLYTRQGVSVRATNEGIGLADKNLTMFVAETRQALVHPYGANIYRTVSISS